MNKELFKTHKKNIDSKIIPSKDFFNKYLDKDVQNESENKRMKSTIDLLRNVLIDECNRKIENNNLNREFYSDCPNDNESRDNIIISNKQTQLLLSEKNELEKILINPYMCRIDIKEGENYYKYYIGGIENSDLEIISWQSELYDLYKKLYLRKLKVRDIEYECVLKRSIRIENSKYINYDDKYCSIPNLGYEKIYKNTNQNIICDSFLKEILIKRKNTTELDNIIQTIQENQYNIISRDNNNHLVLQGCAGSGKSMILLHRLSMLLYRNKNIKRNKVLILTPSKIFNEYIADLTRQEELKISDVEIKTLDDMYLDFINKNTDFDIKKLNTQKSEIFYDLYSADIIREIVDRYLEKGKLFFNNELINNIKSDEKIDLNIKSINEIITKYKNIKNIIKGEIDTIREINSETIYNKVITIFQNNKHIYKNIMDYNNRKFIKNLSVFYNFLQICNETFFLDIQNIIDKLNYLKNQNNKQISEYEEKTTYSLKKEIDKCQTENFEELTILENNTIKELDEIVIEFKEFIKSLNIYNNFEKENLYSKIDKGYEKEVVTKILEKLKDDEEYEHLNLIYKCIYDLKNKLNNIHDELEKEINVIDILQNEIETKNFNNINNSINAIEKLRKNETNNIKEIKSHIKLIEYKEDEIKNILLCIEYLEEIKSYFNMFTKLKDNISKIEYLTNIYTPSQFILTILNNLNIDYNEINSFKLYVMSLILKIYDDELTLDKDLILIDEGQDISLTEYNLFRILNPNCKLNVFGDIYQNTNKNRGINSWENLNLGVEIDTLNENYRNTDKITEYVNKKLNKSMIKIGIDNNLEVVEVKTYNEALNLLEKEKGVKAIIRKNLKYECKDEKYCYVSINNIISKDKINIVSAEESKGLEFNNVIVIDDGMTDNEKYISYTRALNRLIVVK